MEKLVIIGNGPAGLTAAIYAARAGLKPLVFAGSVPGGLLTQTGDVENFPGFPKGINGFELMDNMQQQAERFQTRIEYDVVESIRFTDGGTQYLKTAGGLEIEARAVIISTGASPRWLGIPSENKFRNHGVSACATCDGAFYRDVPVCVVGGGDSACEEASFLTRFASKVYLIHRRDQLLASKSMQQRALENPKIEPVWNSTIAAYHTDEKGEMSSITLQNTTDGTQTVLEVKCVFMAIGHTPVSNFAGDLVDRDEAGFIVTTGAGTATKTPGLFAAGDVADPTYRQAISAAGMGCRAAMDAERYLLTRE